MNELLKSIEILLSLGTIRKFHTLDEAIHWLDKNSNLREYDSFVEQAKEAYSLGKYLFVYEYGDLARAKLKMNISYDYCLGLEMFVNFLDNHSINKDLKKLIS